MDAPSSHVKKDYLVIEGIEYQFIGARAKPELVEWTKHAIGKWRNLPSEPGVSYVPVQFDDFNKIKRTGVVVSTDEETQLWYRVEH